MKRLFLGCLVACSLSIGVVACGGDDDDGDGSPSAGSGSKAGSGGGGGGSGGGGSKPIVNPDPINADCPQGDVGPLTGEYGPHGACCYRTSNKARLDTEAKERVLEYRTTYFFLTNHLKTIDPIVLGPLTISRFDGEEQSILFRFRMPQEDGKVAKGAGHLTIGAGRYNCDGTYSFYGESAAPEGSGLKNKDRWYVPEFDGVVNPEKTDQNLIRPTFKQALPVKNKPTGLPYLETNEFKLDWEGVSQGFDILQMPTGESNIDCVGSRGDDGKWKPAGKTVAFGSVNLNDSDLIDVLGVNFSQLMAFGASSDNAKLDAKALPRCEPGSSGCKWQRLPDSLCPVTDDEKSKWGCHLGYKDNPDNGAVQINCSDDKVDNVDPDNGGKFDGQCCDPLGKETKGLPACNAWIQINDFVASAVDITDSRANSVQESCHGK